MQRIRPRQIEYGNTLLLRDDNGRACAPGGFHGVGRGRVFRTVRSPTHQECRRCTAILSHDLVRVSGVGLVGKGIGSHAVEIRMRRPRQGDGLGCRFPVQARRVSLAPGIRYKDLFRGTGSGFERGIGPSRAATAQNATDFGQPLRNAGHQVQYMGRRFPPADTCVIKAHFFSITSLR